MAASAGAKRPGASSVLSRSRIGSCSSTDGAMREARDASDYHARFLRNFGFSARDEALAGRDLEAARSSWAERSPAEADIPFDELGEVRTLVARGDWASVPPIAAARGRVV